VKAAVDAKTDGDFFIIARTDALASEGFDRMLDRARACVEAGADAIFPEAITDLDMYKRVCDALKVPVLANITEFGKTPLFTLEELRSAKIAIALYPLSAFRAANLAALNVYETLRKHGTQQASVAGMQTRDDLYKYLGYLDYEQKLDALFSKSK
jgi:methylisocitrate lyase